MTDSIHPLLAKCIDRVAPDNSIAIRRAFLDRATGAYSLSITIVVPAEGRKPQQSIRGSVFRGNDPTGALAEIEVWTKRGWKTVDERSSTYIADAIPFDDDADSLRASKSAANDYLYARFADALLVLG